MLSAIVCRVRDETGAVPLVAAYDYHERVFNPPLPILFQRRVGTENRAISAPRIRTLLDEALAATGLTGTDGQPLRFVPHDFRRIFVTDAVNNGMPPHIAQLVVGHRDLNTTMGYKAVYPEEAINGHRAFLARRRDLRPSAEYRTPTDQEWQEFLGHFERRKLALGDCGRAYGTACIHEHSCFSELTVSLPYVRFQVCMPGRVGDGFDHEAGVAAVDAGQGVVEADRDSCCDAGGQEEHAPFAAAGCQLAGVEGGDGCFPVGAGHRGGSVADAVPVVMKRLVKSSRCSQLSQSIRRLVPASRGSMPLAQARRAAGSRAGLTAVTGFLSGLTG